MILNNINSNMTADMCVAVRELGFWNTIKNYEGECSAYGLYEIMFKLDEHPFSDKYSYSAAAFSVCMQNVQYIARHDIEVHILRDMTLDVLNAVRELDLWDTIKEQDTERLSLILRPAIDRLSRHHLVIENAHNLELLMLCLRNVHYFAKYDIDVYQTAE